MWTINSFKGYINCKLTFSSLQAFAYFLKKISKETWDNTYAEAYDGNYNVLIKVNACSNIYDISIISPFDESYLSELDKASLLKIKQEIKDLECGL